MSYPDVVLLFWFFQCVLFESFSFYYVIHSYFLLRCHLMWLVLMLCTIYQWWWSITLRWNTGWLGLKRQLFWRAFLALTLHAKATSNSQEISSKVLLKKSELYMCFPPAVILVSTLSFMLICYIFHLKIHRHCRLKTALEI